MYTFVYVFVQIIKKGNDVVLLELVSRGQCIVQSVVQFLYMGIWVHASLITFML